MYITFPQFWQRCSPSPVTAPLNESRRAEQRSRRSMLQHAIGKVKLSMTRKAFECGSSKPMLSNVVIFTSIGHDLHPRTAGVRARCLKGVSAQPCQQTAGKVRPRGDYPSAGAITLPPMRLAMALVLSGMAWA